MLDDIRQSVEFSHHLLKRHIPEGAGVIDATAGNGKDTLFLAELVGPEGEVWAFDIQEEAVENTKKLLKQNNVFKRVNLNKAGHENMNKYIDNKVLGIIFNLGYLPGGNKDIVTRSQTTLAALKSGLKILKNKGIIVLVFYTGHPGGQDEFDHIFDYVKKLNYKKYNVLNYNFINQKNPPARLIAVKKRAKDNR